MSEDVELPSAILVCWRRPWGTEPTGGDGYAGPCWKVLDAEFQTVDEWLDSFISVTPIEILAEVRLPEGVLR